VSAEGLKNMLGLLVVILEFGLGGAELAGVRTELPCSSIRTRAVHYRHRLSHLGTVWCFAITGERLGGTLLNCRPGWPGSDTQVLDLLSRDILAGKYNVRAEISERGGPGPPRVSEHALLWGSTESTLDTKEAQALKLCHSFIESLSNEKSRAPFRARAQERRNEPGHRSGAGESSNSNRAA
jgi:hypothetical protein